jgi:hypothetical protein
LSYIYFLRVEQLSAAEREEFDEQLNGPDRRKRADLVARMGGEVRQAG